MKKEQNKDKIKYKFYILHKDAEEIFKEELFTYDNEKPNIDVLSSYIEWDMNGITESCINKLEKWIDCDFKDNEFLLSNGYKIILERIESD